MSLQPGTRLGSYEVTAAIGQGGMGEVYQARDTALNRDVAIKVLPAALADDPDRLARFQREAESLAALNHPNIATVHGLERSGETPAIVMELVDGQTLADRLRTGPLPLEEALAIARQVADALGAAHSRGIVHRDLKPANIKVKPNGTVKVLDFGLAKALDPSATGDGTHAASSPTVTSPALTQMGLILGTAAYMSPEQAKGRTVDTRADIWAFGCVVYEMLSGRQTWGGETVTDVIAALVAREPDWNRLPPTLPSRLRFLLERCLEKDVSKRTQNIGEVRAELERAASDPAGAMPVAPPVARPAGWASRLAWPLATLAVSAAAAGAVWMSMRPGPTSPVRLAALHPGPEVPGGNHFNANVAISPDGTRLAYTTTTSAFNQNAMPLYGRGLDESEPRLLSEAARAPFFSPDGEWVGFVKDNGPLMKVAFSGGPAVRIGGDANANRGMSWGPDGTIVFATSDPARGLSRISDAGDGEEQALTTPDTDRGEVDHLFPEFLPGADTLLFTIAYGSGDFRIAILDLDSGTYDTLIPAGSDAHYASSGHIVYGVDGTLRAVAFDPGRRAVRGTPVPVADGLVTWLSGAASFAISNNGTLVYITGEAENEGSASARRALVALDREGRSRTVSDEYRGYGDPRVSPDGRRIAVTVTEGTRESEATHIWIVDASSGLGTQLTFAGTRNLDPV
ncbi:MAG TPA: protein kinase, partial [Vicinamibacterales bacterium]|nr:protein kinase [Vicinamibacterales bacterium]